METEQYKTFTIVNNYGLFWVWHKRGQLMTISYSLSEAKQYVDHFIETTNAGLRGLHAALVILDEATKIC